MKGAEVGIVVLHDLLTDLIDSVAQVAERLAHAVVHTLDRFASLAAAIGQLIGKRVSVLHLIDAHVGNGRNDIVANGRDVLIDPVHLVQLIVAQRRDAVGDTVQRLSGGLLIEAVLNLGTGSRIGAAIAATETIAAVTKAADLIKIFIRKL